MIAVDRILGKVGIFSIVTMASIPLIWSAGPQIEPHIAPPVGRAEILNWRQDGDNGFLFDTRFEKLRACRFIGISWYDANNTVVFITPPPSPPERDKTRPEGWNLAVGWRTTRPSLSGLRAIVTHRCHPLWDLLTQFYP